MTRNIVLTQEKDGLRERLRSESSRCSIPTKSRNCASRASAWPAATPARQLLVLAAGPDVQFADREVVQSIVARTRERIYGLRSLVHEVVQSPAFFTK